MGCVLAFDKGGGLGVIKEGKVMGGDKVLKFEAPGIDIRGAPEVVMGIGVYARRRSYLPLLAYLMA